jgi:four helix bundle protein
MGNAESEMKSQELQHRTKAFALAVIRFVEQLPSGKTADVFGRQLLRSATSVGANYRAACRARSRADFISKMSIVEEEADESCYWLELITDSGLVLSSGTAVLSKEAGEITAMAVASIKSARKASQLTHSAFRIPHSALTDGERR